MFTKQPRQSKFIPLFHKYFVKTCITLTVITTVLAGYAGYSNYVHFQELKAQYLQQQEATNSSENKGSESASNS